MYPDSIQIHRGDEGAIVEFSEWLLREMAGRNMTAQELARQSGVDPATLSNILTKSRKIGPEVARKLAAVFGQEQWVVFKAAGLLTEAPKLDGKAANPVLSSIARELEKHVDDTEYLELVLAMLRTLNRHRGASSNETQPLRSA